MITNITKGKVIAFKYKLANNIFTRFIGLMGKKSLPFDEALILYPCSGIHTLFMRFPLDCIFLDKNNCIIHIIFNFKPWKISPIFPNAYTIIEFPANTLSDSNVQLGDYIQI